MSTFALTLYVLIWPVIAAGVMLVLTIGVWHDLREAKKNGDTMV